MSPSYSTLAVVALLLLAAGAVAPAADGASAGAAQPAAGSDANGQYAQAVDPDGVTMTVALQPDGDAEWTVTYRVRLEDDNETAAFESLRNDVRSDPENYTGSFAERMRTTAGTAENATGREMSVRNVTVDARVQELGRTYGILEYTFEWTNFAVVDDDTITAGDALHGLFLDDQTTLVVSWPGAYEPADTRPTPDDDVSGEQSVGWSGPEDFGEGEPQVVIERRSGGSGGILAALADKTLLAAVVVALGSLGIAALWFQRRRVPVSSAVETEAEDGTTDDENASDDEQVETAEELLSNEEKVLKLVSERGGRVKQQEIVEALDWTEAKTSQVVQGLRDEGTLEAFRLGRENVLRLPDEDEE